MRAGSGRAEYVLSHFRTNKHLTLKQSQPMPVELDELSTPVISREIVDYIIVALAEFEVVATTLEISANVITPAELDRLRPTLLSLDIEPAHPRPVTFGWRGIQLFDDDRICRTIGALTMISYSSALSMY
jgi:hypothetical protein